MVTVSSLHFQHGRHGRPLPYLNPRLPTSERVQDLLSRLTLAEKAGLLFHGLIYPGPDGSLSDGNPAYSVPGTADSIERMQMNHFCLLGPVDDVRSVATWYNNVQSFAISNTRLGIPVTISTDPRNHFTENLGTSSRAGKLSQWPETLGLAAIRDVALVERFADVARQEYVALGIRVALSPQVDLSTEYRWARIRGTFGESAALTSALTAAYLKGFQAPQLAGGIGKIGQESVSCMTKHFPGGGPQAGGEDAHFVYGKDQVYPGNNLDYHLAPFVEAIKCGSRQMMPYYGRPVGLKGYEEEVGFAFHRRIITDLLRRDLGFEGIVCSDWGIITDQEMLGQLMPARAWGCETLTDLQRFVKIMEAGCDQIGGETRVDLVIEAVEKGLVSEERIDRSIRLLLREKFELGLFDNPFVDVERAVEIVGNATFLAEANAAQRKSYTLLTNKERVLPLSLEHTRKKKVYVENVDIKVLREVYGLNIVDDIGKADIALLRLRTPYDKRPGGFEAGFHAGNLQFSAEERARQAKIYATVSITIVDLYLDRPAAVPEIASQASALLSSYGSNVFAFLDVVFSIDGARPGGRLPFDMPRSMAACQVSREDMQADTKDPLFMFGHGLEYFR